MPLHARTTVQLRSSRRQWLLASGAAAVGLPRLLASPFGLRAAAPTPARKARAVLFIMLPDGIAQHDSFDPKPLAPAEIRGEFQPIATSVGGISICELLPKLAVRADRYALLRSMAHHLGQSLLLARRLIEAGVGFIQANQGPVQTWDTHEANFVRLKGELLPQLDQAVAALLDDLHANGLLAETLIVMASEFGRTPRISLVPGAQHAGRNHWAHGYTAFVAGAGVQGGQTIGRTDDLGAYPVTRAYTPDDLGATLLGALGLSVESTLVDSLGRPHKLSSGEPIEALYRA